MMKLRDNPKFKEDYANYQKAISEIDNDEFKQECIDLLKKFVNEVNAIDLHHDAIFTSKRLPEAIQESRTNLASVKKRLDAKLAQYKPNQLSN